MASAAKPFQQITLEKRVKALPQELQDIIYDFTFELPTPATVTIHLKSKPPVHLHINRSIREPFASHYFCSTTFRSNDLRILQDYVLSLPSAYRVLLRSLQLHGYRDGVIDGSRGVARARATKFWQSLPSEVREEIDYDVIEASYVFEASPGFTANLKWVWAQRPWAYPAHWQATLDAARREWKPRYWCA